MNEFLFYLIAGCICGIYFWGIYKQKQEESKVEQNIQLFKDEMKEGVSSWEDVVQYISDNVSESGFNLTTFSDKVNLTGDVQMNFIYKSDFDKIIGIKFNRHSIQYLDSRRRILNTIKRDLLFQVAHDCLELSELVFLDSCLISYIDEIKFCVIDKIEGHLVFSIERETFNKINSEFGLERIHDIISQVRPLPFEPAYFKSSDGDPSVSEDVGDLELSYIYVLTNPTMNDIVKIGKTTRTPEDRARELSRGTGVPVDFQVAYEHSVQDCDLVEKMIHRKLAQYRVSNNREFFQLSLKDAIDAVRSVAAEVEES